MNTRESLGRRIRVLRDALRRRPDTEHEMTINRVVLLSLVLGYLCIAAAIGHEGASAMLAKSWRVFAGHYVVTLLLIWHLIMRPGASPVRRLVAIVVDLGSLSFGAYAGGDAAAAIYPIYLWVILGNGFRFGVSYLFAASVVSIIGFTTVIAVTPFWRDNLPLSIGLLIALAALPAYVSTLIRKLNQAKAEAEAASRAKSLFLASVSHELRTPLNAVIGFSDLLDDGRLQGDQSELNRAIGAAGRSLLTLINKLLELSRREAQQGEAPPVSFDLAAALFAARNMVFVQARQKDLQVNVFIGEGAPLRLRGQASQLGEVLVNLAGNAVKFTASGHVVIAAGPSGAPGLLRFEVRDTGIGIAPEARERIFERFTQADATIIDRFGGTGLGLSIVKDIVEAQGGRIGVDSEPGQGSTFWFEWPFEADATTEPARAAVVSLFSSDERFRQRWTNALTRRGVVIAPLGATAMTGQVIVLDGADAGWRDVAETLAADRKVGGLTILLAAPDRGFVLEQADEALVNAVAPVAPDADALTWSLAIVDKAGGARQDGPVVTSASLAGLRVLVAEDNLVNQKVASLILGKAGIVVTLANNGEEALRALEASDFDVVLMDVNMPVMNGIDAARLYRVGRGSDGGAPILALTADVTPETEARCREAGMIGCVTKPINQDVLLAKLAEVIGARPAVDRPAEAPGADLSGSEIDEAARDVLRELGGDAFLAELTGDFLDSASAAMETLIRAREERDSETFRQASHALKSAAGNVGAEQVRQLCAAWCDATEASLADPATDTGRLAAAMLRFQHRLATGAVEEPDLSAGEEARISYSKRS